MRPSGPQAPRSVPGKDDVTREMEPLAPPATASGSAVYRRQQLQALAASGHRVRFATG